MPNNSGTDLYIIIRYDKYSVYHNTMLRTALPTSWRSNWRKQSRFPISSCTVHISNQQCQLERDQNALGAWHRDLPRRDHFRDWNNVDFTKNIAKSFADRCKSRLTFKISNALSKHFSLRKWRLFTFAEIISRRTMNLTFPNASRVDYV